MDLGGDKIGESLMGNLFKGIMNNVMSETTNSLFKVKAMNGGSMAALKKSGTLNFKGTNNKQRDMYDLLMSEHQGNLVYTSNFIQQTHISVHLSAETTPFEVVDNIKVKLQRTCFPLYTGSDVYHLEINDLSYPDVRPILEKRQQFKKHRDLLAAEMHKFGLSKD